MTSLLEGNIALVVAHPDDEILWFSSLAERARKIIVCYLDVPGQPNWGAGRRRAIAEYPLPTAEFLGLTESMAFRGADWSAPVPTAFGLEVQRRPGTLAAFDPALYRSNFDRLVSELGPRLTGLDAVVTHNPWGEYGHEEHVQVYRAVKRVAGECGIDLWYSNHCSDRSYALMLQSIDGRRSDYLTLPTDRVLARRVEALYRACDCWTWPFDDYPYFEHESFMLDHEPDAAAGRGSTLPLNYIKIIDPPIPPPEHGLSRALRRSRRWLKRHLGVARMDGR